MLVLRSRKPWHESSSQPKLPSCIGFQSMFPRPCRLQRFIIEKDLMRLMTEFPEIARIRHSTSKETLRSNLHLLLIGFMLQTRILRIQPRQERGIISVNDEKAHTY